jgi:DNA-binding response OmpR family regulator
MAKILVVEDERELCSLLAEVLTAQNHLVDILVNGREAQSQLRINPNYDLLIIDWGLPEVSGIEICKEVRARGATFPILMLTGRREIGEKETGFDSGADDYLTKPFEPREFMARVRALLRRVPAVSLGKLTVGCLQLEPDNHRVTRDGVEIYLQPREFRLLEFLMRHPGQLFSAEALIDRIWPSESDISPENLRTSISKLRSKIDDKGKESMLKSVYGVGYKLEPPTKKN